MRVEGRYYFDVVEGYHRRHCMKPGITGWAQVNGSRGEVASLVDASNRFAFDLFYVQNWSIWLDLLILWRTASGAFFTESD
jgi:lipopolysaccharide/colanic/teichoic acid biosynthesis glycosyltransferase